MAARSSDAAKEQRCSGGPAAKREELVADGVVLLVGHRFARGAARHARGAEEEQRGTHA
jgi:hypothetical protein